MIIVKTQKEIEAMREGGKILAGIMEKLGQEIAPGKSTQDLDKLAEELVFLAGGKPAFKGYGDQKNPYPATICASINDEVVHGIPDEKVIIEKGDILKIDIGMEYGGLITDMARTYPVGKISRRAEKILEATKKSLDAGILRLKAGADLRDYSRAVQSYAESEGFSPVHDLVGHGVGRILHEDPIILNYIPKKNQERIILKAGMTLALEPMINEGTFEIKLGEDGWVYLTADGKLSAHFEDTVVITEDGCEILTR
jgi:methionyl aminopeptidase